MSASRAAALLRRICFITVSLPALTSTSAAHAQVDAQQAGVKYSPLKQINRANVANLELAWQYHTGEKTTTELSKALISFQDEPTLVEGNLIVCSTSRRVIALDPRTGKERWVFDPKDKLLGFQKCRGIATWQDARAPSAAHCRTRIFLGSANNKLFALDAKDGKACEHFGTDGVVVIQPSKPEIFFGELVTASRPAVVGDTVVVGSMVTDNQRVDAPSGRVIAFDARSGEQRWQFDPVPRDPADPASKSWERGTGEGYGGGNVWATMAVDQKRDMVYLPTTSPSGDFYGGGRAGDNRYTSSVVALRGTTGEMVWNFQFVHHNVFDYDTPTQPILIDYPYQGKTVPALVQFGKTGLIFIFNRETGEPLIPIEERPVPQQGAVPGEVLSPTQPFPVGMPTLVQQGFSPDDAWGFTFIDRWICRNKIEKHLSGPIFTPPSEQGTIMVPSVGGGPNWGGGGYDPDSHLLVVPTNRFPVILTMIKRENARLDDAQELEMGGAMIFENAGAPYVPQVEPLMSPFNSPCSAPPWAALTAVDLVRKKIVWEVPLGNLRKLLPIPISWEAGTPGAGGPLVTAGGLVFIGYTLDDTIRAFDLKTGEVLWHADLPAAGTAVPVTYEIDGEQYVVLPAGGHSMYQTTMSDAVVAYRLKR